MVSLLVEEKLSLRLVSSVLSVRVRWTLFFWTKNLELTLTHLQLKRANSNYASKCLLSVQTDTGICMKSLKTLVRPLFTIMMFERNQKQAWFCSVETRLHAPKFVVSAK